MFQRLIRFAAPLAVLMLVIALVAGHSVFANRTMSPTALTSPQKTWVPKRNLKVEKAQWTFAPEVPPPTNRKEPRLLTVSWKIKETEKEIAPGVLYKTYWTFEGQAPGPMLRGRVGDVFRIEVKNEAANLHNHNIDFHFVTGPGGGAMDLNTGPGNTSIIEVRATAPGLYMYHCATPDIPVHISNGMYGYVLIEPEDGLPKVDHEYYIVQSEFYAPDDTPGEKFISLEHLKNEHPQYVVFNGKVGALTGDKKLAIYKNETVRLYVGNAGLNLASNFHIIGEIFDKVYPEGDLISPPRQSIQTTLIPAGGATVVEFKAEVPGNYLLVDHALVRAIYKGAVGIIKVFGEHGYPEKEIFESIKHGSANLTHPESADQADQATDPHAMPPPKPAPNNSSAKPAQSNASAPATPASPTPYIVSGNSFTIDILSSSSSGLKTLSQSYIQVGPGTTVTWVNKEPGGVHSITALDNTFRTPNLKTGERASITFREKGIYRYYCNPHTWIVGTVEVK